MSTPVSGTAALALVPLRPTPLSWRIALAVGITALAAVAVAAGDTLHPRLRSGLGVVAFLGVAFLLSANIRAVTPRVVLAGFCLQIILATPIIHAAPVRAFFDQLG